MSDTEAGGPTEPGEPADRPGSGESAGRTGSGEPAGRPGSGESAGQAGAGVPRPVVDLRKAEGPRQPPPPNGPSTEEPREAARAGRFWSTRRLPALLAAAVLLGAVGLLLYDVAAVRADQPAMYWRRRLADELATRPLDNGWIIGSAALAMLLGLWLLALALTPGLRRVLPMRRDTADVRAGLDRSAAGLVLRDRAMEVSGVRSVRVDVGRRKVRARVQSHFRELDEVRAELDTVLSAGIRQLGLARPLGLSVQVRRPRKPK